MWCKRSETDSSMGHDPQNKDAVCVLNKVTQTGGVEKVTDLSYTEQNVLKSL